MRARPSTVLAHGRVAGMTTYMEVDAKWKRAEIGSTWYARNVLRTALNTEAKLLLLTHAFETLGGIAVELHTSWFNHPSRREIERLVPIRMACCATTVGTRMARFDTWSCSAFSPRSGRA